MQKSIFFIVLTLMISCGKNNSSGTPDHVRTVAPSTPPQVSPEDFNAIPDLHPTTYYAPQEKNISCQGRYGTTSSQVYDGNETSQILDKNNNLIATVCTRFYKILLMEGFAILKNRGQGELAVNFFSQTSQGTKFRLIDRCLYGEGAKPNLCLLPYHSLATDNKAHQIGDIIYIPKVEGLRLPDGTIHEGFFIVRDTGSAFRNTGPQRVDMFTGIDPDNNNVFSKAGLTRNRPMIAFKISGKSAELIKQRLKDQFEDLY